MGRESWVPHRTIRVPDPRWLRARARADEEQTTLSAVVNDFLEQYGQHKETTDD